MPEFAMLRKYLRRSSTVEPRPREERAPDVLADGWRQIDRWVNEGGAEGRTAAEYISRSLEP
jgi:hypothetical protein